MRNKPISLIDERNKLGLANLSSQNVPRQVVERSLRPALVDFCSPSKLNPSLVASLHSIISIFPHLFNTAFATKLTQTLKGLVTHYPTTPATPIIMMVCKMFDVFVVFAANKVFDCGQYAKTLVDIAAALQVTWFPSTQLEIAREIPLALSRFLFLFPEQGLQALHAHPSLLSVVFSSPYAYPLSLAFRKNAIFADRVSLQGFQQYFCNHELSDVTLVVGSERLQVPAHQVVLSRCPFFATLLFGGMSESGQATISLESFPVSTFLVCLKVIYGADPSESVCSSADIQSLVAIFEMSDFLGLEDLARECESRLCFMCDNTSVWALLQLACQQSGKGLGSCLMATCETFILSHLAEAHTLLN